MDLIKKFKITDNFFGRYERLIKDSVIPYQENAIKDMIDGAEPSHAVENFRLAAEMLETGKCSSEFYGMVFQDSDVAKWLEGAAYSLALFPDEQLEKRCDEIIDLIGRAQHKDGYLNTYFTVKEPQRRWTNLAEAHELYCEGHMIEAAVAYYECTGKRKLLDIMCRMADHTYKHFITEGAEGYPGHPEIELALMRLYRCTQNKKYLELASAFIDRRGTDNYFSRESEKRGWSVWGSWTSNSEYNQSHAPVRSQDKAVGHAVRAMYLYTGMADAAMETGDKSLAEACRRLWKNVTLCRMYLTGAIGSAYEGEAFTEDYHLPNDTAYGETCAAIGLIFFARKMLELEQKGEYADVMERALYNCVLAGMELDGTKFFYVNPLEAIPGISGKAATHPHTLPQRPKWFACACCPPNVARLLPSIAEYAWNIKDNTLYSNLFIGGILDLSESLGGKITVDTLYPYDGKISYGFEPTGDKMSLTLAVRIPSWSDSFAFTLDGKPINPQINDGYAYIKGDFTENSIVELTLDMSPKRVYCSPKVSDNTGKAAVMRGPLVYCAEGADNNSDVLSLSLAENGLLTALPYNSQKLMGICEIEADGYRTEIPSALYTASRPERTPCKIKLVPYYSWANRGLNQMRVWLPEE